MRFRIAFERLSAMFTGSALGIIAVIAVSVIGFILLPLHELYIGSLMAVYIVLAIGMNFVFGVARQFALAHAGLYGVGAYASALLTSRYGAGFLTGLVAALVVGALVAALIGMTAFRTTDLYLAMITLAAGEGIFFIANNWDSVTNGPDGISLSGPTLLGFAVGSDHATYVVMVACAVVASAVGILIERSRVGRQLTALGDSQTAVAALGYRPNALKTIAFALSGAYAGVAGAMYAGLVRYVSPEQFGITTLLIVLTMVVLGGLGSTLGAISGAVSLTILAEVLRPYPGVREVAYGGLLLAVFIAFPDGLAGLGRRIRNSGRGRAQSANPQGIPRTTGDVKSEAHS